MFLVKFINLFGSKMVCFLFSKPYNVIIIQNPFILVNIVPYHPKKILFFTFCMILVVAHFLVVDVFSHTGDFIDDVNILNIFNQRLNKAKIDYIFLRQGQC